jgi:hypothetical protein
MGVGAAEALGGAGDGAGAGDRRLDLPSLSPYRLEARAVPRGRLAGPPRLSAGAVVPLVLTHDVGTDVPGSVRAWVARDVYDSETHSVVVLPRRRAPKRWRASFATLARAAQTLVPPCRC